MKRSPSDIFTMWITTRREMYKGMMRRKILQPSIPFHALQWETAFRSGGALAYKLYLSRPARLRTTYLFEIDRQDDTQTREVHFGEDGHD